ncbi:clathrin interactor epsin [Anaeramoeba flamelloides]|uniref:Clathrin interactor epsin n=1 Tax=Anaeramoeba flamelloides TaxID=1746091 RepID=A0AAV7YD84_9EUKA|nr:clathrin interactor epsin [Anaeramoeba flamelloides]
MSNYNTDSTDNTDDFLKVKGGTATAFYVILIIDSIWFLLSGFFFLRHVLKVKLRKLSYKKILDPRGRMALQSERSGYLERQLKGEEFVWFSGVTSISGIRKFLVFWVLGMGIAATAISIAFIKYETWCLSILIMGTMLCIFTGAACWNGVYARTRIVYGLTPTRILLLGFRFKNDFRDFPIQVNKYTDYSTHWDNAKSLIITTDHWITTSRDKNGRTHTHHHSMKIGICWIFEMDQVNNIIEQRQEQLQGQGIEGQEQQQQDTKMPLNRSDFPNGGMNQNGPMRLLKQPQNPNQMKMNQLNMNQMNMNQMNMNQLNQNQINQMNQNQTNNGMNNDFSMQGPTDLTLNYDLNNNNEQMGVEMNNDMNLNYVGTMDNDLEMNKF